MKHPSAVGFDLLRLFTVFLKSPAGEALKTVIGAEAAELEERAVAFLRHRPTETANHVQPISGDVSEGD